MIFIHITIADRYLKVTLHSNYTPNVAQPTIGGNSAHDSIVIIAARVRQTPQFAMFHSRNW